MKTSEKFKDLVENAYDWFNDIFAALLLGAAFLFTVPVQVIAWLRTGQVPPRDLFWATANVRCDATGGEPRGWEGMDLCRPEYIKFSDWIGVDRILNYLFDVHLLVVAVLAVIVTQAALVVLVTGVTGRSQ